MNTDLDHARKDALAFLKRHKVGVIATSAHEYQVHASTVYYISDDDFNIYFFTLVTSRKYEALQGHPQVAFTISAEDIPQTLQIEGIAMDILLEEEVFKKKDELFEVLNSNQWFAGPVTKLDPALSAIIWIRPTWIRWADYAFEQVGDRHVFKEIPIIK